MQSITLPTRRGLLWAGLVATTPLAAMPAVAQTAGDGVAIEEVIVTAQKRAERLQDVPLAVTAVTGDALQARQINDTNNLVQAVPSLTYQQGPNPTNTSFRIRGIGTSLFGQGVESSVSVVVDGVVAGRGSQSFADLADIERVEILRGPQGTLFGKNATAGVINVVTAAPAFEFGGKASATVAEGDEYRVSGSVTGPLTGTLAGRITGYYNDVRGYIRNLGAGGWVNGYESWGLRGKLLWRPTDDLSVLASAEYRENDADCCVGVSVASTTPNLIRVLTPVVSGPKNRQVATDGLGFAYAQQATYSIEADYDLGWGTVTAITALQKYKQDANNEVDNIFNPVPEYVGGTTGNAYAQFNVNGGLLHLEQFSQEVRLASSGERKLTYVVGAYYSWLELDRPFVRRRAYCPAGTAAQIGQPCPVLRWESLGAYSLLQSTHHALFGQAEYALTDQLKLLGGLRVQRERVSSEGFRYGPLVPGDVLFSGQPSANAGTNAADTSITGKAGAKYEFSRNAQVYATYTRGYKGLGIGTEVASDFANQKPILPEHVDAYELGFKGQTADRRASVAVAVFLADYTNLQVQANRSDPNTGVIRFEQTNAGSSETKGVEIEGQFNPTESFSIAAAVTYAKATIDIDGLNCPLQFQASSVVVPLNGARPIGVCYRPTTLVSNVATVGAPTQDVRGGALPATPRWRASLTPTYRFALGDAFGGSMQVNVAYQSKLNYALEQDPLTVQKGYTIVDANLSLYTADQKYRLTFFVKNLFDQNYYTSIGHNGLLSSTTNATDLQANIAKASDRYVGATLDVRF